MALFQSFKKFFWFDPKEEHEAENPAVAPTELAHINQAIYKQSAELAERNKTLSLLQRINEVILSSIIHPEEVARLVTSLLVTHIDFQIVSIFLYDKDLNTVKRLACSYLDKDGKLISEDQLENSFHSQLSLKDSTNLIIQSIVNKKLQTTTSLKNVLFSTTKDNSYIGSSDYVKSVFIYPFMVRGEVIGAIIIGLKDEQENLSDYRKDLLNRLAEVIGIGIDNAMLYNKVQTTNKQLVELDKLKNEFVSVASHELRTPMTAIKSYLWMALNGKGGALNEKQHYYVERGYNSVDRLIRLVNDMLNISRIESGRITVDVQSVDMVKLTQDVVDEVLPRANEIGVTVTVQKPEMLPPVLADPDKIKEVLFNLIGNSLKFTPKGGAITISYAQKDGFVDISVKDTGVGIDSQDIGKLFQKFGLLPGSYITNQTVMGTGLGLYICRSIIELHHGEIHAASEGRGKGTTFTFSLREFKESDLQLFKTETPVDKDDKVGLIHVAL